MIRVGIEGKRPPVLSRIRTLGAAVLVSANSLWNDSRKRFSNTWHHYAGLDIALDSGGFVAMRKFGGYRYTPEQYVELARRMRPTWWAQMDFCCEPEIAANRGEVAKRIDRTAKHLQECQRQAQARGVEMPLIVLQGWKPEDYCKGPIYDQPFNWPDLVGVGSVCRRVVGGPDGILSVVAALHDALPSNVKLHLFGVKGEALRHLRNHPRFFSMDSMAWCFNARKVARAARIPCDNNLRAERLEVWYRNQSAIDPQLQFAV